MNVLPPRSSTSPKRSPAIPPGPVTFGLAVGLATGAAVLLTSLSPILFAASLVALSAVAIGKAIADRKEGQQDDERGECWEESAARIAGCVESLAVELDRPSDRFQTLILNQEQQSYRLH